MNTSTTENPLDTFEFASTRKLEEAFLAGELSEKDAKVLLARKPEITVKGMGLLLKDWKATKKFEAEYGASRKWGA
jgi:hypothetical protein